nr:RHS repeat-associated core domain-containing protein [Pseudomonas putida]HDS0990120.1 RHS repeat-associated core domain-containing protein [Pseudomonas putida]
MPTSLQYTVYGHDGCDQFAPVLRFSGQRREYATGHYLLGNGYRAFSSVLMRFNAPDSLSPFAQGGLNAYSYCGGDPVNRNDPTGHNWRAWLTGRARSSSTAGNTRPTSHNVITTATSTEQKQFNQRMSNKLKQHNATVSAPSPSFKEGLAYQGRDTGERVQVISEASSWSFNDHVLVEAAAVSLTRDYPNSSHSPEFRKLFENTVALETKIRSALPANAKLYPDAKWLLDEDRHQIRVAG